MLLYKVLIVTMLAIIAAFDFLKYKIPNMILIPFVVVAIIIHRYNLWAHIYSSIFFFLVFFYMHYFKKGLGFGDVKLAASLGLCLGFSNFLLASIFGTLLAIIYATILYVQVKTTRNNKENILFSKIKIPYGAFLSLSSMPLVFVRNFF